MGFLFFPVMPMGLCWAALRAAEAPLLRKHVLQIKFAYYSFEGVNEPNL